MRAGSALVKRPDSLMAMPALFAAAAPSAEAIRETAREVVARSEFQLRPVHDSRPLWDLLWRVLRPIFEFFAGLWAISPVLAWIVIIVLSGICLVIIGHIVYSFSQAISRGTSLAAGLALERKKVDPIELERQAENAAVKQDFISAVRLLFRASLLRIAQREKRELRPGTTNREYLRRYAQSRYATALQQFATVIDAKWYGYGVCDADDYLACRNAHRTILSASEASYAHSA
jgi:hypothetical protein